MAINTKVEGKGDGFLLGSIGLYYEFGLWLC